MMKIELVKGDITTISADAIVNAANSSLLGGSGVDGAIHRKGGQAITQACMDVRNRQGGCKAGEAVITTAGNLPAKYVIHTVGPVWSGGTRGEKELLRSCYNNCLKLAVQYKVKTIAFPCIGTGIYHFPKEIAANVAISVVERFADICGIDKIIFVCYDEGNYHLYETILSEKN